VTKRQIREANLFPYNAESLALFLSKGVLMTGHSTNGTWVGWCWLAGKWQAVCSARKRAARHRLHSLNLCPDCRIIQHRLRPPMRHGKSNQSRNQTTG
jgi:hypothetical protein